jgi:hypothetical protein
MARSKFTGPLMSAVSIGIGVVGSNQLNNISFFQQNPQMAGFAKVGIGALIAGTQKKGSFIQNVGLGVAVDGTVQAVNSFLNKNGVSGLPATGSTSVHTILGTPTARRQPMYAAPKVMMD